MAGGWSNWYAKIRGCAMSVEGEVIRHTTELGYRGWNFQTGTWLLSTWLSIVFCWSGQRNRAGGSMSLHLDPTLCNWSVITTAWVLLLIGTLQRLTIQTLHWHTCSEAHTMDWTLHLSASSRCSAYSPLLTAGRKNKCLSCGHCTTACWLSN